VFLLVHPSNNHLESMGKNYSAQWNDITTIIIQRLAHWPCIEATLTISHDSMIPRKHSTAQTLASTMGIIFGKK
jgi:hypothetical protein